GCPVRKGALALFECDRGRSIPAGDHVILLGRVVRASFDDAASPLLFSSGRYAVAARLPNIDASSDLAAMWEGLG
ncbi:MAG: flavin reductase family protein, partial [Paracoccus sp. (in: a-proteobacteria)]